ncbi:Lysosomal acid phosphatase, partial [Stegodyphus mimosarum]
MLGLKLHLLFVPLIICLTNIHVLGLFDYNITMEDNHMFPFSSSEVNSNFLEHGKKLIQLHIFSRHGMRAPDLLYPSDPNPEAVWKEGLGRLTQLGKFQSYALGRQLRWRYRDFISSHPHEVQVLSGEKNRCILSALCHVAALYVPNSNWEFLPNFPWQPIPVKYKSIGRDKYLGTDKECPAAMKAAAEMLESEEGKAFLESHKTIFQYLSHRSGLKIETWADAAALYDILSVEKAYNLIIPSWARQNWEELEWINDMSLYFATKSREYQRLKAVPLLAHIAKLMKERIKGEGKKVYVYSGHKKNLAAVLNALEVYNRKEPPFCSTLVFEFYKEHEKHTVRLLYFNSTTPQNGDQEPYVLTLPACDEFCPFVNFKRAIIKLNLFNGTEEWEKECEIKY